MNPAPARASVMASIGDQGVLNKALADPLGEIWIDRDLGWLDFNDRVLAEALDHRTPLLERAKFLAIFTSNLDEFFMKRVAILRASRSPEQKALLAKLRERLVGSLERQAACYRDQLLPALAAEGIHLRGWDSLSPARQEEAGRFFDRDISPAVTPLVFDQAHAFPFLSNLSTSLAFVLYDASRGTASYARVKVPAVLQQWIPLTADVPEGQRVLVALHEVLRGNIQKLYAGMQLTGTTLFRLTRDAEVESDEDEEEVGPDVVREQIRQRRYEPVVRLEFAPGGNRSIREMLRQRFDLNPEDVYDLPGELDYTSLFEIAGLPVPSLRDMPWTPLRPPAIQNGSSIFAAIRTADILVHHPYESFEDSVEHFIAAAAADPETVVVR